MNNLRKLVAEKFKSGNSIEVERITITRAEYESAFKLTDAGAETSIPFVGITPKDAGIVTLHQTAPLIDGNTSDGYHTFNELYDFRKAYNAALFNEWAISNKYSVHKSKRHYDGEECFGGGWFIVVAQLPNGQISNHYEMKDWELFQLPETEKAMFDYDNHTGADVLQRLFSLRTLSQPEQEPEHNHLSDAMSVLHDVNTELIENALDNKAANARELGLDYEPEQEPVARFNWNESKFEWLTKYSYDKHHMKPLYLAPPKPWVGLTDDEVWECQHLSGDFYRAIEAKLKEKNT